jgi:hypothetical protein
MGMIVSWNCFLGTVRGEGGGFFRIPLLDPLLLHLVLLLLLRWARARIIGTCFDRGVTYIVTRSLGWADAKIHQSWGGVVREKG